MTGNESAFIVGLDLGQAKDFTALCVVERVLPPRADAASALVPPPRSDITHDVRGSARSDGANTSRFSGAAYHVRHLERPPLGTKYPQVVARVQALLATPPLTRKTPLVIDKTGVGTAVADLFTAGGIEPYAVTIHGGDEVSRQGRHSKVPKRELVGTLVMLFQSDRLKIAAGLAEGPTLVNELVNFKVKVNIATGHDTYEAWRESVHDDLVLSVALACWFGEQEEERLPFSWLTDDPDFRAAVLGRGGL